MQTGRMRTRGVSETPRIAVSPAGFHNAELYEGLRDSCGPLVALLADEEEKTRANAAGALGNLVRNSSLLCRPLIQAGALQARLCLSHQSVLRHTADCWSHCRWTRRC